MLLNIHDVIIVSWIFIQQLQISWSDTQNSLRSLRIAVGYPRRCSCSLRELRPSAGIQNSSSQTLRDLLRETSDHPPALDEIESKFMKLTILGSGTCVPSLKRSSPANFLKIKKHNIFVDCGSGTLKQLIKIKESYKDIDYVFLTHFHTDHISDLNALIQALNWTPRFTRKKDLILVGPVGLKKYCAKRYIKTDTEPSTFKIKIKEIRKGLKFDGFNVEAVKTVHSKESIAYKFKEKNKSLVITGDCDYNENLVRFSKNSDILLIECSFANNMKEVGHLTSKECAEIAKKADVKKLVLTHLYPPVSTEKKRFDYVKKRFKKTILAKDLMKVEV